MVFYINFAGLKYRINSIFDGFYSICKEKYECEEVEDAFSIAVDYEDIQAERKLASGLPDESLETTALLRKIIVHCLDYQRMMIHGSCIKYHNQGVLFIGPSGIGKTTHTLLWKDNLGDDVTIINGDKPMLEFGDSIIVHGTPWSGKESLGENSSAPLKAIVRIVQSETNSISQLSSKEAFIAVYCQTFEIRNPSCTNKQLGFLNRIVSEIPIYELKCNTSEDAFRVSYNELY